MAVPIIKIKGLRCLVTGFGKYFDTETRPVSVPRAVQFQFSTVTRPRTEEGLELSLHAGASTQDSGGHARLPVLNARDFVRGRDG